MNLHLLKRVRERDRTEKDAQKHAVCLVNVNKWYGNFHVLKDILLGVEAGERIVIVGSSGSGKSTMIRCINRLEEHQVGSSSMASSSPTEGLQKRRFQFAGT
jgi:general L-amino acid transport system ATP-binding protein